MKYASSCKIANWRKGLTESCLLLVVLAVLAGGCASAQTSATSMLPLHVAGNRVVNAKDKDVLLHGVCVPGLEWSVDGDRDVQSVQQATAIWHANIVRIPLSQDYWLGMAKGQTDGGAAYRDLIHTVVKTGNANSAYVILDLHWSDRGIWNVDVGQHKMPDPHSILFWKSLAATYANAPGVLFDLYNEPHDVSADVWRNGGVTSDHRADGVPDVSYQAPGMQTLLDTVRSTGAKNVCIVGTVDWAYSTRDLMHGYALTDPTGNGIIYANHAYPFKGESVVDWEHRLQSAAAKYPVIVSEFGASPPRANQTYLGAEGPGADGTADQWVKQVLGAIQANHWNFTAWCFHPSAGPCLIADWNYTPTTYFGAYLKPALARTAKYPDPDAGSAMTAVKER